MNINAVRIAVPNLNNYVNPKSLAWLGDQVEPAGSPAGQLQLELLRAAEELVAEGNRRLGDVSAEPRPLPLPSGMAEARSTLAGVASAAKWLSFIAKLEEMQGLLEAKANVR